MSPDFIGITREPVYSPGKVEADALVLHAVAEHLRQAGASVVTCRGEADAWPEPQSHTLVFTMAQGPAALARLQRWEGQGVRVVNATESIRNCHRQRTVARLCEAGVGLPETLLLPTHEALPDLPAWCAGDVWIKRGDVHATEVDDVVRVVGHALPSALRAFHRRGIMHVAVQRHVEGRVLKFYAVAESFFFCVPPGDGTPVPPSIEARLAELARRGAAALGLEVYGGDAVWAADGALSLIDLNDWPSYGACRAQGAAAIAAHFLAQKATP